MAISALLSAYNLQPISASVTAISSGKLQNTLQPLGQTVASTASATSSSAQLGQDTYTPSTQSQAAQSASGTSSSSAVSNASSAQSSQGDTVTLASLIQNQTISGSADVRQVLQPILNEDNYAAWGDAYNALAADVYAGDYSGAQTALTNYTTGLASLNYDTSAISNQVNNLSNALQSGNKENVANAFIELHNEAVAGNDTWNVQFNLPALTGQLQKLGYTAANAVAEANAIVLGDVIDEANPQVFYDVGVAASDLPQVDASISDLAKVSAHSPDSSTLSNIISSLVGQNTLADTEATLNQLDAEYGPASQGTPTDPGNASQATASVQT